MTRQSYILEAVARALYEADVSKRGRTVSWAGLEPEARDLWRELAPVAMATERSAAASWYVSRERGEALARSRDKKHRQAGIAKEMIP